MVIHLYFTAVFNRQNASALEESSCVDMPWLFSFTSYTILAERMSSANEKKKKALVSLQSATEMFLPSKKYSPLSRQPTADDGSALYRSLCQYGRFTRLWWILSPEPEPVTLPIPPIEEIIYCEEFLQAQGLENQLAFLMEKCKIDDTLVEDIASLTIGQRDNPLWHRIRRRLTAGNFGVVLHAKRVTASVIEVDGGIRYFSG